MEKIVIRTLNGVWPMVLIFTSIIVLLRLFYLFCNKKKFVLHKELLMLFFVIYVLLLYYIVTFQDNNYGTNNFIPFKEIFRYKINTQLFYKNIVGNILLFIPFGLFLSYYIKPKSFLPPLFLSVSVSTLIEVVQSVIGRTADVDDIILNSVGGIIGYLLYLFFNKISDKIPKKLKSSFVLDILSLLFIFIIMYMAIKFEFWRIIL